MISNSYKNKQILIHIGLQKTGSSWLQRNLFTHTELGFNPLIPRHQTIIPGSKQVKYCSNYFHQYLTYSNDLYFDENTVRNEIERECFIDTNKTNVISSESLSGNPALSYTCSLQLCDRLHKVFPEAKILIGIREQKDISISLYAQYLRMGGCLPPDEYFAISKSRSFPYSMNYGRLHYDKLISHYYAKFGKENVMVYPVEEWKFNIYSFLNDLSVFLSKTYDLKKHAYLPASNVRLSFASQDVLRRLSPVLLKVQANAYSTLGFFRNRFMYEKIAKVLDKIICSRFKDKREKHVWDALPLEIMSQYKQSNSMTSSLINKDLTHFNYIMPEY